MLKEASHHCGGRNDHFPARWEAENIVLENKLADRISCVLANQNNSGCSLTLLFGRLCQANPIVSENDFRDGRPLIAWLQAGVVYCECGRSPLRVDSQDHLVILDLYPVQTAFGMPIDHYRRVDVAKCVLPNSPGPKLPIIRFQIKAGFATDHHVAF